MRRRMLVLLSVVVALVVCLVSPASADDVAASPGCRGRSDASQYIEADTFRSDIAADTRVWIGLSECDTQDTIQKLQGNAWGFGGCALAFDAVGTAVPPVKLQASAGKLICAAAGLSNAAFAGTLSQADQNGGGCGTIIKYGILMSYVPDRGVTYTPYGFAIVPRPCRPGVTPKAELGSQYVAGPGAGPVDWATYDYAALPDLAAPSTDAVYTAPDGGEATFASVERPSVGTDSCAPVTVPVPPVWDIGADSVPATGTTGLDQLRFGTASVGGDGSVTYTPTADGTDTFSFTYGGPLPFDVAATVTVAGCGSGQPGPPADIPGCPTSAGTSGGSQGCTIPADGSRYQIMVRTESESNPGSSGGVGHVSGWGVSPGSTLSVTSTQYGCQDAYAYPPPDCPPSFIVNRDQINVVADGRVSNIIVIRSEARGWPPVTDGTGPFTSTWWVERV